MKLNKLAPWNWFKSEDNEEQAGNQETALRQRCDEWPLNRWFGEHYSGNWPLLSPGWWKISEHDSLLKPSLDISESKNHYKVKVEIPGVDKKDIKVDVLDHALVIKGEKKQENEEENEHYHRVERCYGSFQRILNLPPDAETSEVDAKFKNGVLTLNVKRNEERRTEAHRIDINVN